ncbi:MAG: hypothetical protein ACO2OR_05065 [Desulfurococcaceae archaeon]
MNCEICHSKPAVYKCRVCGRRVCSDDYDVSDGVCSACSVTLCKVCRRNLSIATCSDCGRHCCEDCLVEISPLEYICIVCFKSRS